jgi:hypothetical protein
MCAMDESQGTSQPRISLSARFQATAWVISRCPAIYQPKQSKHTRPEHVAAPLDTDKTSVNLGKRSYPKLARGTPDRARMTCDLWRIAIVEFCNHEPKQAVKNVNEIIRYLEGLQSPDIPQENLSSSHLMKNYCHLPYMRGFQFFARFSVASDIERHIYDCRKDERDALLNTTLYSVVNVRKFDPVKQMEEWKTNGGIFRRDNGEHPHGLFDPGWRVHLRTVAERLLKDRGYFDRLEIKSKGKVGVLKRTMVVSLDQASHGVKG